MEQISSLLHFDVSKFKDIFNILHKLEEDGVVKEISDLFYKIFTSESKFTIGELIKIQKERSDKINVNKQYENNLSLFKSNFGLIVQLLLDNTFKVVVKENQSKLAKEKANSGEETETTNQTIEDAQTPRQRETPSSAKKNDSPQQKSKKTINQTSEQKKPTKEKQSNSTAMLQGIISKDIGCQSSRSSKEYERENSLTQSQQLSSSSKKRSSNSIMSPLKIPVTSEFNHIQGSATFPQSERKFLDVNLNGPGPAFYEVSRASPSNLKRSVSPTIGKAPRQTWIEVSTKTASPGPGGLYPSHHFISK